MNRIWKTLISLLICVSAIFSLVSCKDKDDGAECPPTPNDYRMYWFETYEELAVALDTLKAHGNVFDSVAAFDCEGLVLNGKAVDVKYQLKCTFFPGNLKEGENILTQKADVVDVRWFLFEEYVPISDLEDYEKCDKKIVFYSPKYKYPNLDIVVEDRELLTVFVPGIVQDAFWNPEKYYGDMDIFVSSGVREDYSVYYDGERLCSFCTTEEKYPTRAELPPKEFFDSVVKTVFIIEGNR